jgi:hypothetical protein
MENPRIKLWASPREVLFYMRVLAGLRALVHKAGVKLNLYRIARETCRARGLLP